MLLACLLLLVYGEQAQQRFNYMILKRFLIIALLVFLPTLSWAQSTGTVTPQVSPLLDRLKTVGTGAGYNEATEATALDIVGMVINGLLGFLGIIFIILMLLAGYRWMNANGDEEKITKSKDTIRQAIIGLLIVIGAFAIWRFIANYLI